MHISNHSAPSPLDSVAPPRATPFSPKTAGIATRPNTCPPQHLQAKKKGCVTLCHLRFCSTCARAPTRLGGLPMERSEVGWRWPTSPAPNRRVSSPLHPTGSLSPSRVPHRFHQKTARITKRPNTRPTRMLQASAQTFFAYCHLQILASPRRFSVQTKRRHQLTNASPSIEPRLGRRVVATGGARRSEASQAQPVVSIPAKTPTPAGVQESFE